MYRRPKFLEVLLAIREEMAREADHDVDFFVEMIRTGIEPATDEKHGMTEGQPSSTERRNGRPGKRKKTRRERKSLP